MIEKPYTHVGFVVDDLEKAMASFGAALDLEWATVLSWELELWTPSGTSKVRSTFTYARGGSPSIELLQNEPGSIWTVGAATAHHIGYWSTDLVADGAELASRGYEMIATLASDGGGPTGFSYHAGPAGGTLIELVDASLKPRFARWWSGDRF
jgi:hypothetical protein